MAPKYCARESALLSSRHVRPWSSGLCLVVAVLPLLFAGCGRVVAQKATEQLIAGDAVDRTIAQVDFRILGGKKVYLDTQYVNKTVPGVGFVTSEYIISSIRQKMMCDGCLLEEKADEADFVVEMRIGALGADGHEIIYGIPPNNYLSLAASVSQAPPQATTVLPSMPELSVAKKNDQMAAAKIALFAYNRRTREPIWQSGISESRSTVADRWYLGAGPFHKGNIYGTKKQAQLEAPIFSSDEEESTKSEYFAERRFADPTKSLSENVAAAKPAAAAPAPAPVAATPAPATAGAATPAAAVAAAPTATKPVMPSAPPVKPTAETAPGSPVAAPKTASSAPTTNAAPAANPTSAANTPASTTATPAAAANSSTGQGNAPASPAKTDRSMTFAAPEGRLDFRADVLVIMKA